MNRPDTRIYDTIFSPNTPNETPSYLRTEAPIAEQNSQQLLLYKGKDGYRVMIPFPDQFATPKADALKLVRDIAAAFTPDRASASTITPPEFSKPRPILTVNKPVAPVTVTPAPVEAPKAVITPEAAPVAATAPVSAGTDTSRLVSTASRWRKLEIKPGFTYNFRVKPRYPDLVERIVKLRNRQMTFAQIAGELGVEIGKIGVIVYAVEKYAARYDALQKLLAAEEAPVVAAPKAMPLPIRQSRPVRDVKPVEPVSEPTGRFGFSESEHELRTLIKSYRRRKLPYTKIAKLTGAHRDRIADYLLADDFFDEEVRIQAECRRAGRMRD
ncbi:hypothetical protein C8J25_101840 [Sphingomonas faeni]|uniref:Uncharacterized protein n=1 Tax=Sphingomonas faeni TaxID=185950 RepID=A0A2T5UCU2_9SPHN|nr:hypothetical protein [Sphingomonas faeni]PTW49332.1 hypothetical protein C8J25_101840 [Sphingomonas faeni]